VPRQPPIADAGPAHEPDSDLTIEATGAAEIEIQPWPLLWRERAQQRVGASDRQPWIVLATVLCGLFAVGFTITVLAVSLELIATDLDASRATVTWVVTGPLLAAAVLGPTWGKLADLHGARRMYLIGMTGAAVFAGLTALAWTAGSLIAFRVLAAAAGAAAGPASMALINTSFDRERRVQAMGYWALVGAGGPVVGVVAGGPVVEAFGWQWIFIAQAPITALCVLVGYLVLPETPRRPDVRLDVPGAVLIALAAGAALLALNRGPIDGWTAPLVVASFVAAPVLLAAWVAVERRAPAPLFPLEYLRRRNFAFPITNQFLTNFAYMGGFIITPALLQEVMDLTVSQSGYVSILRPLTFAVAGPVAGWLALRSGERRMGVLGTALVAGSMAVFAAASTTSSLGLVLAALALSGIGMGAASPAMAASVANAVADHDLGIAGAAQQMVATLGTVAGIQVLFTVQEASASTDLAGSFQAAYLVGGAACLAGVVAAWFVVPTAWMRTRLQVVDDDRAAAA
jgi:EmrB/QacA subfamily drug resistance transporter